MRQTTIFAFLFLSGFLAAASGQSPVLESYPPGPDSLPQPGVPRGEVLKFTFEKSKIFPGTWREYWVYVPAQYSPDKPACVYVNQDGIQWNAPTVFDNLINKKEMPVTIGVFVRPGVVKALNTAGSLDRFNRSYEYDGLGDSYARFLLEELLPDVETKTSSDGRAIRLSKDGNDRAIGGSSSGAICAFTAAWERPDAFSRVFSAIGTYVGLRGGDRIHSLIRKYEPKPLRVFLQDGSGDLNIYGGDWWMANQTIDRALVFAGYQVSHHWGEGGHNGKLGTALFPDAMRYLWDGWPNPVRGGVSNNDTLRALLDPAAGWQLVAEGFRFTEGPAVNSNGEVYFTDVPNNGIFKIGADGRVSSFVSNSNRASGQAFGPDGALYTVLADQIVKYDAGGRATPIVTGLAANDIVISSTGNMYVTNPPATGSNDPSKIWLIRPNGQKVELDSGLKFANGIALSPDQSLLYVADMRSHWVYSFQVQADGTLANKQKYYWLLVPDTADDSGADGMKVDSEGRLYVATRMGIQVCDQAGRVNAIIPTPNGRVANLTFGGSDFRTLYAACGDRIYRRRLKVRGSNAWEPPSRPTAPRL